MPDSELDRELDDTIQDFSDLQAELNYRQAQEVLRELIGNLDLSAREQSGLETEIHSLETMLDKLDRQVVHIAVFGMVGRGKSSLLNALLGQEVFETGAVHGVTQQVQTAQWSAKPEGEFWRVSLPGLGNSQVELIDTPGIDEVDGETREVMARQLAKHADLILFVIAGDMTRIEFEALSELRKASKPILLVLNKMDQYPEADRRVIYEKIRDDRVKELLSPDEIVMAAASPLMARAVRREDGTLIARMGRGVPDVQGVKLKILEILQREGKALVALNTMLYTDDVNEQLVQRKLEIRDRTANQVIWNAVMTKAVAIALNPVTVLDLLSATIVDIALILTLSRLYGFPLTQQGAVGLLQKIALSMGGITVSELIATLGLGSLKSLLGLSAPATGGLSLAPYLSIAITQAGVAGVSTHIIGQVAKTYLANGASWGDETPKALVSRILSSLDEASILNRIKDELRDKLDPNRHQSPIN
ncbi:MAG: GTP-binding protein [Drouetiella hepatica Uher 2000/2452]|uniref:GTP-binding protein n=1 Tax=Drouetiella hepatica Uher 2000/2452 TaxID=904376 RepID=A0A951Q7Q1_9CYAN|nr:GTP-binding protein [Drouetiella hepatica Uher 2000/2452]